MRKIFILIFSLAFAVPHMYAGEEKIPWGASAHDAEFKYLQERSPDLEEAWDELESEDQESRLSAVQDAAVERREEVTEYYQIMMRKWDVEALKEYGNGVSPGDMKAFGIWLGGEKVRALQTKTDVVRYFTQKAETEGLTADEALSLEPYLQPEAIDALKHAKFSKDFFQKKAEPRDYLSSAHSAAGLKDLSGKTPGLVEGKDLSKFYDGSKSGKDPTADLTGPGVSGLDGGKLLTADARATSATTIKHTAPDGFESAGGEEGIPEKEIVITSGKGRGLTDSEIASARAIYGDKIDYSKVRIITGEDMTLWGKILTHGKAAVAWGNTIYFPNNEDGSSKYNPENEKKNGWLTHELGHTYQYQKDGWSYAAKSVWEQITKGEAAYEYDIEPGKEFGKYGIEQQATIIQDYFRGAIPPSKRLEVERMLREEGLLGGIPTGPVDPGIPIL